MLGNAIGIGIPFTVGITFRGRVGSGLVVTAGTTITFSPELSSTDYSVFIRCYDGSGNNIDFLFTEKAKTGFKITPAINGTVDYIVIFGESASMRFASEAVTTGGTAISFSSVLAGLGYGGLVRCFDGSGNNIDFALTSKAIGGFTITSAINGTAEYIAILGNTSSIKTGVEAVITTGTVIAFNSALVTTSYVVGIRCYDGSGNNVDYTLTNKIKAGFTITPAVDCDIDYVAVMNNNPIIFGRRFLPSKDELNAMRTNLLLHAVGGFDTSYYWSSSETANDAALSQLFSNGSQPPAIKDNTLRVRACRSFTASVGAYSLRDIGPGGGLIFYINGITYFEAAPSDQSASQIWSNIDGTEIGVSAQGTAIGTGQANTLAIIAQAGHTDSAAKVCDDLN